MIELTVKTLDSQNHAFSVEDDITVAQFKEKIAEKIDISADTQRIIYCGRVLKDEVKLKDYDVHGKVVHLVQRAPPSANQNSSRSASPPPQRRNVRGFDNGNAMYLGSVAFPSNLMESQGIVPPPPTHSLAASRLNVAKRMLRRAEAVLNLLENPQTRTSEPSPPEEVQEEVTPVFEARVIVPNNQISDAIDEAFVLSAVQNTLLNASSRARSTTSSAAESSSTEAAGTSQNADIEVPHVHSASSTPEGASPTTASTENLASEARSSEETAGGSNTLSDNASPTSEMADLLDTLGRLQVRFAPFLEQYQNFMRQDPTIPQEETRKTQAMINRVSEILHFLGHAYHSLSDIIVRVRTPPPRPLLCRPILIQHSAVLQTGFPIQVEAQINFGPETGNSTVTTSQTSATTTPTTASSSPPQTATTTSDTNTNPTPAGATAGPTITAHIPPQLLGFPLLPPAGMHLQSFPIEIRGIPRHSNGNNASNLGQGIGAMPRMAFSNPTNASAAPNDSAGGTPTAAPNTTTANNASDGNTPFNNPNVEFFMEVTPESITIDSLETTLLGGNPPSDLLRGPPPEFLQSIMQMAGQIISRGGQNFTTAVTTAGMTPTAPASDNSQSTQPNISSSQPAGQNSQARGNTQTNPTTSTQTRSTARPHVHLAQHAMQGFDPFLPCNSHHVTPRRRAQQRNAPQQGSQNNNSRTQQGLPNQFNPIYNIVHGILSSFQNVYRQRGAPQGAAQSAPGATNDVNSGASGESAIPPGLPFASFLPHLQSMNLSDLNPQGPTIAQLLQQLPDETYVEGESIFTDLIMLLSRNLTIGDIMNLNNGRLEPLMRIRMDLRNFFMLRVLDGTPNMINTDRGVNRLITEMQPFLENLNRLTVRDDIDIVRSTQMLFRARLPNIISLAASRSPNSVRMLVEQCRITARQLFALILHASANGQQGVEDVLDHMVSRYMQGIPSEIQQWTLMASQAHLRQFISNLSVPQSILQPYIVRTVDSVTCSSMEPTQAEARDNADAEEPMELDEQEASGSSTELGAPVLNLSDDPEPLPAVIIGSEPWHSQVPADWVPIIARDNQRQRRQNQQQPFSDAYLSGMPSKRRKIVTSAKPQGSLPQVITESVRRAVTATGLTTVSPLETVSQAAGADLNIQSAYRDLLRTSVQANLEGNEDFTPERFPNASNYFNKPQ